MSSSAQVGRVEIVALVDTPLGGPLDVIFPSVPEQAWEPYREIYPRSWEGAQFRHNAQCFLLVTPTERVLVDTGLGPGPHAMLGGARGALLDELREAGTAPGEVDRVVFTHLHGDHIGWTVNGGAATFPAARHLVPQADWTHFRAPDGGEADPVVAAQIEPLEEMGLLDLVEGERAVTPELTLVPTPGHTPGHQSLLVSSGGERALILGDVANHPAQVEEIEWSPIFDGDAEAAAATRRAVMERLEQGGDLVVAGHFPHPGFGHLVRLRGRRVFRTL